MGSLIASIAGPLVGGLLGSDASSDAADAQSAAAARTDATNRYIFDTQTELQRPFRETGVTANNRLAQLLGLSEGGEGNGSLMQTFGRDQFEADPGYQFRMDEGMKGVENSGAARGMQLSGATLKALQKYGQGVASQEYNNAFGRFNADQTNQYNRLAGVVNSGMGATNQISNAAAQFGQNTASNNAAMGNAQAAGAIGQANAWSNGIGQAINGYQQNQLMQAIQRPGPSASPAAGSGGYFFDY